ncbi:hypothetical protein ACHAXT_003934 [Thalassiosira profunda]
MNHLCGIPSFDGASPPSGLTAEERGALAAFRQRYETALQNELGCTDIANGEREVPESDGEEEKKDSPSQHFQEEGGKVLPAPVYEIDGEELPPSGLRTLDDVTLYRYLLADRSHKDGTFDEDASYHRLIAAMQFRKESNCDSIVQNLASSAIPPNVQKCQRLRVGIWAGLDVEQRPVVFERLGQFFSSGNAIKMPQEDWMLSYLYYLETHFLQMRKAAERTGKSIQRIVYFADFQGVVSSIVNRKIWKVIQMLKALAKTIECHYPELVDHIVLFNVPRVASAAYNYFKGFLDPVTAAKIELFPGVPYDRFKELMGEEVIPVEYGGKNEVEYPQTASE